MLEGLLTYLPDCTWTNK